MDFTDSSHPQLIERKPKVMNEQRTLMALLAILLLGAIGTAGYFYLQYDNLKKNPNKAGIDETKALINAVGKLIVLPTGEEPTIATVTDLTQLKDQPFFVNAQKGDKVLIYTSAKKAILYDPQANKIVEVAPINLSPNQATPTSTKKK